MDSRSRKQARRQQSSGLLFDLVDLIVWSSLFVCGVIATFIALGPLIAIGSLILMLILLSRK